MFLGFSIGLCVDGVWAVGIVWGMFGWVFGCFSKMSHWNPVGCFEPSRMGLFDSCPRLLFLLETTCFRVWFRAVLK